MQSEFRKVISDGDLLLQSRGRWWPFYGGKWSNYRNESEEVRLLKQHMDNAFMHYKEMQRLFVIAQTNVKTDMQLLQMYKVDNSEVEYLIPHELSILEERDGIKYKTNTGNGGGGGNNNGGKGGNGGGSNQNQNQNQQQSKKQKGQQHRTMTPLELLTQVRLVMPNGNHHQQQQAH